jgi:regulator of protease activity HflC (stomatin/prohibitin superfamily)
MRTLITILITAAILAAILIVTNLFLGLLAVEVVGGVLFGLFLLTVVFGLLTPLFITHLVNTPGGREKSGFHLFTYPEEGMVKIVIRGNRVIRMIMMYGEHRFARKGKIDQAKHWQIVKGESEDPLYLVHPLLRPWAQYVYSNTGAVFTGIWPFQTVREYYLERTKIFREERPGQNDNLVLKVDTDVSDHFRARQFLYPFRVAAADTKDRVPLNILAVIKAHVKNPHKAAYGTDRWDQQTVNLATNAVTSFTGKKTFEEMLASMGTDNSAELNKAITDIKDDEVKYGIEIDGVDIVDISPNLSDEDKSKLYAEVLAKAQADATRVDGKARADALRELNKANAEGGEYALASIETEALVRAAEAAKGGTIILGRGVSAGSESQTLAAILAELKKQTNTQQRSNP